MKYFKLVLSILACLAFIVAIFFLRGDFVTRRIQEDMLSSNLLELDAGSNIFISRTNDNSKIIFGDEKLIASGALIPNGDGSYTGGFKLDNVEILDLTQSIDNMPQLITYSNPRGILTASLSNDRKYLATISTDYLLKVYNLSEKKELAFKEPIKVLRFDPLIGNNTSPPFIFWTNEGLVYNVSIQDEIVWGVKDKTQIFPRLYIPETMEHKILVDSDNLIEAIGKIDNSTLLLLETPRDITLPKKLLAYKDGKTEEFAADANFFAFSQTPNPGFFYNEDGKIKIAKALNPKEKSDLPLPQIDDKQITANETANLRITSRGYLCFEIPSSGKTYLHDPWSGVSVVVPDGKAPY